MPPTKTSSQKIMPQVMIIYGPEGIGKTSLCCHMDNPKVIYDSRERGVIRLKHKKLVPDVETQEVNSWEELLSALDSSRDSSHSVIVIDSMKGVERFGFQYHADAFFDGDMSKKGFFMFQQGPVSFAQETLTRFMAICDRLTDVGKLVVLIGHSEIRTFSNPVGSDYDRFVLSLNKTMYNSIKAWAGTILFMNYAVDLSDQSYGKKTKAVPVVKRNLYCTWNPLWDAKSMSMPDVIAADDPKSLWQSMREYLY